MVKVNESQIRALSESMFDTAGVPQGIRTGYWDRYARMQNKLRKQ